MRRIAALALSAALLASLTTPVLAAPAVDTALPAPVLWRQKTTTGPCGSFPGPLRPTSATPHGQEMTQAEMDASLAEYCGKLQFQFDANGGATMIQGGGTVQGTYQYLDDGSVGVIFDYNGEELRYACIFGWTEEDELLMVAISNIDGKDGVYFVQ